MGNFGVCNPFIPKVALSHGRRYEALAPCILFLQPNACRAEDPKDCFIAGTQGSLPTRRHDQGISFWFLVFTNNQ